MSSGDLSFSLIEGFSWATLISTLGLGKTWALFGFFAKLFRADRGVVGAKFRPIDRDCAVFGLFSWGSDGLCLKLFTLKSKRLFDKICPHSQTYNNEFARWIFIKSYVIFNIL